MIKPTNTLKHIKIKNKKSKPSPTTMVCKLLNCKDKISILQKCIRQKGTFNYINEDFSKETLALRKDLWKEI